MRFTDSKSARFKFDLPGVVNDVGIPDVDIELYKATWDFEIIDVDLVGTLTAVQDFTLDIDELPLLVTLENGDTISGYKLGDTIEFNLPDWDADNLGNADGKIDYRIDVDMDAIFNNYTTLDFDLDLFLRALKARFTIDTFVTDKATINLFGDSDSGYFALNEQFDLIDISPVAVLFGEEDIADSGFEIIGWNSQSYQNAFDVA